MRPIATRATMMTYSTSPWPASSPQKRLRKGCMLDSSAESAAVGGGQGEGTARGRHVQGRDHAPPEGRIYCITLDKPGPSGKSHEHVQASTRGQRTRST